MAGIRNKIDPHFFCGLRAGAVSQIYQFLSRTQRPDTHLPFLIAQANTDKLYRAAVMLRIRIGQTLDCASMTERNADVLTNYTAAKQLQRRSIGMGYARVFNDQHSIGQRFEQRLKLRIVG